ncbi:MAG: DUF2141 domain-containing protein [Chitinophagaceae bacterium]|nr:DUF2141 domain-containing protein [Chitinophagaceae bacterium]
MNPFNSLFLLFFLPVISWRSEPANEISIIINNLRNSKGQVLVSLFKDGDGYPDEPEKAFRKGKATIISGNRATLSFTDLPSGEYAAVILHDENSNLKMDKNWIGLPKEGYGFSNNVMGTFGPPGFSKASFRHTADKLSVVSIRLRY